MTVVFEPQYLVDSVYGRGDAYSTPQRPSTFYSHSPFTNIQIPHPDYSLESSSVKFIGYGQRKEYV